MPAGATISTGLLPLMVLGEFEIFGAGNARFLTTGIPESDAMIPYFSQAKLTQMIIAEIIM